MFKVSNKEATEFLIGNKVTKLDINYSLDCLQDSLKALTEQIEQLEYIKDQDQLLKINQQLLSLSNDIDNLIQ